MNMVCTMLAAATFVWPEPTREMKPWVYNWWMGSAVNEPGLRHQCGELKDRASSGPAGAARTDA